MFTLWRSGEFKSRKGWRTVHGAQDEFICNICFAGRWDLGVKPRYRIHFLSPSEVQRAPYPERKLKWATQHLIEKMLLSFLVCVSKQCLREGKSKDFISWADTSGSDNPCLSVKGIAHVAKFLGDKHVYGPYKNDLSCCHLKDQKTKFGGEQFGCQRKSCRLHETT